MIKKLLLSASFIALTAGIISCGSDGNEPDIPQPEPPATTTFSFAKGADVGWLTELEDNGCKFRTPKGEEMECMKLLRDYCGVNSVRLRVWVNPEGKYNTIDDVMVKARRAHSLGMRIMIDFHLSDNWADPSKQITPAAWADLTPAEIAEAIKGHVTDMLGTMQKEGISPEWVQIGNETIPGMLHPTGEMKDQDPGEFPRYLNAGYDAVKAIFPDAQVIVHLDQGNQKGNYQWFFDLLEKHNGRYDMIGMSIYPENEYYTPSWHVITNHSAITDCIENIKYLNKRYGKKVMICEIGFHHTKAEDCKNTIAKFMQSFAGDDSLQGIFYWEPESEPDNTGYHKGCFENGCPTCALDPFTGNN